MNALCQAERAPEPCSGGPRCPGSVYCPQRQQPPQGLPLRATWHEFLGLWARVVELDITPPPPPQCFRIQGQDPQDRVKWSEAQFSCEQQEAQLVTIANPLEQGRASPWEVPSIL